MPTAADKQHTKPAPGRNEPIALVRREPTEENRRNGLQALQIMAIIYGISVVGVMVVWVAFLIWFAARAIFLI